MRGSPFLSNQAGERTRLQHDWFEFVKSTLFGFENVSPRTMWGLVVCGNNDQSDWARILRFFKEENQPNFRGADATGGGHVRETLLQTTKKERRNYALFICLFL